MNRTIKIGSIVGITLFIAGLFLSFLSLSLNHFDFTKLDLTPEYKEITQQFKVNELKNIDIQSVNQKIKIEPSKDEFIHITYYENELETYQVEVVDNDLTVKYKNNQTIMENIFNSFRYGMMQIKMNNIMVKIEIPENYNEKLNVSSINNQIHINHIQSGKINLKNTNGSIVVKDLNCTLLDMKNTNGSIKLDSVTLENLNITTTNGSIKLDSVTSAEAMISSINGSIKFNRLLGTQFNFKNSNGSVKGSILGNKQDYNISIKKENGSSNLENQFSNTNKKLEVKTINGSTKIEFINR